MLKSGLNTRSWSSQPTRAQRQEIGLFRAITLAIALVLLFLIVVMFRQFSITAQQYNELGIAHSNHSEAETRVQELYKTSSALTRFSRTYVVTGEPRFRRLFENVMGVRDGSAPLPEDDNLLHWEFMSTELPQSPSGFKAPTAFDQMIEMESLTPDERALLGEARKRSDSLAQLEIQMMSQVPQDAQIPDYVTRLFDENYHQKKLSIMQPLNDVYASMDQRLEAALDTAHARIARTTRRHFIVFCLSLGVAGGLVLMLYLSRRRIIGNLQIRVQVGAENLNKSIKQLRAAQDELKALKGLIPICTYCHQVRNKDGEWSHLEVYLSENSDATLSHKVCPNCNDILVRELEEIERET